MSRIQRFGNEKKLKSLSGVRLVLIIVFAAVFAYCAFMVGSYLLDGYMNNQLMKSIREEIPAAASAVHGSASLPLGSSAASSSAEAQAVAAGKAEYQTLLAINPDAVGWISVPGMNIDYPVARAQDNSYYLTHSFDAKESSHGCIFLDCRDAGDNTDNHIVIYGHNMRDGSMFGQLSQYKDASFYKVHPVIQLNMRGVATTWQIFSVSVSNDEALPVGFSSQAEFAGYVQTLKVSSLYDTGVTVSDEDQILTLSTCSHDYENARFVVSAVKVDVAKS